MDKTMSDNVDVNKIDPKTSVKATDYLNKFYMDTYNPKNVITISDHGDQYGPISYNKNAKIAAKEIQNEIAVLDKYKNNPNMPIELAACKAGQTNVVKELSLLEPNREIIAYEGDYLTALAFGFKKVIYKNGEIIYSKKDFNFINTNKAR